LPFPPKGEMEKKEEGKRSSQCPSSREKSRKIEEKRKEGRRVRHHDFNPKKGGKKERKRRERETLFHFVREESWRKKGEKNLASNKKK